MMSATAAALPTTAYCVVPDHWHGQEMCVGIMHCLFTSMPDPAQAFRNGLAKKRHEAVIIALKADYDDDDDNNNHDDDEACWYCPAAVQLAMLGC